MCPRVGCGAQGFEKSEYGSRISVRCAGIRPSARTFHAGIQLNELAPLLAAAGATRVDLGVIAPRFPSLRLDPAIPVQGRVYYRAQFSIDPLPPRITIDGGFEISQVRALAVAAVASGDFLAANLSRLVLAGDGQAGGTVLSRG
jgi:hypothetical protein